MENSFENTDDRFPYEPIGTKQVGKLFHQNTSSKIVALRLAGQLQSFQTIQS